MFLLLLVKMVHYIVNMFTKSEICLVLLLSLVKMVHYIVYMFTKGEVCLGFSSTFPIEGRNYLRFE